VMIISADGHPAPAEILTPPTEDLFPRVTCTSRSASGSARRAAT
jgi:hypothetical protein